MPCDKACIGCGDRESSAEATVIDLGDDDSQDKNEPQQVTSSGIDTDEQIMAHMKALDREELCKLLKVLASERMDMASIFRELLDDNDECGSVLPEFKKNGMHGALHPMPHHASSKLSLDSTFSSADRTMQLMRAFASQGSHIDLAISIAVENPGSSLKTSNHASVIQFASSQFYCVENENKVTVEVLRLGAEHTACAISYFTKDGSAKSGVKYKDMSGTIHFTSGERSKCITIELTDDSQWEASTEFNVILCDPVDALLGQHMHRTRVKIIDDDYFPTNKLKAQLDAGAADLSWGRSWQVKAGDPNQHIYVPRLFLEFLKMALKNSVIRDGSIKEILGSFFRVLQDLFTLLAMRYLVDYVLEEDRSLVMTDSKRIHLLLISAILVSVNLIQCVTAYNRCFWRVYGCLVKTLQANLMRKFFMLTLHAHGQTSPGEVIKAVTSGAPTLVKKGYLSMLAAIGSLMKLTALLLYTFLQLNWSPRPYCLAFALCYPVIVAIMLGCFGEHLRLATKKSHAKEVEFVDLVDNNVGNLPLIADFSKRARTGDQIEEAIDAQNKAAVHANSVSTLYMNICGLLGMLCIAAYMNIGGHLVLENKILVGAFLSDLAVLRQVGKEVERMYGFFLNMKQAFIPLMNITHLMNLPDEGVARLNMFRAQQLACQESRVRCERYEHRLNQEDKGTVPADLMPIEISARFSHFVRGELSASFVWENCAMSQGHMIAVVGKIGQGKSTFLKLLSGLLIPDSGQVVIPLHLKVHHVSSAPVLFLGSLLENLTFGWDRAREELQPLAISTCKRLGLSDWTISAITEGHSGEWSNLLSQTEIRIIHIARALVANPEVLILDRPTLGVDTATTHSILDVLKCFVTDKGMECDSEIPRRLRTCIFSTVRRDGVDHADEILQVTVDSVKHVTRAEVAAGALIDSNSTNFANRSASAHLTDSASRRQCI